MWTLIKEILAVLIVIYLFSQIVLPSFIPEMEYFNLHKKKKPKPPKVTETLDDLDVEATQASEKMKDVKEKVDATEQKVDEIKTKLN